MRYNHEGLFEHTSPKVSFYFGLILGLAVVSAIGFLILLSRQGVGQTSSARVEGAKASADAAVPAGEGAIAFAPVGDDDHIRGAKNPTLTFVEYSDLECPFCKSFHGTMKQLIATYPEDVQWVYRHFPLDSLHQKARAEANAAECAGEQEKFWELVDRIFEVTPSNDGLDPNTLPEMAKSLGLDVKKFEKCLQENKYAEKIQSHLDDATRAGGRGTPYSVVITKNGETFPISGALPFESLDQSVKQFLQK